MTADGAWPRAGSMFSGYGGAIRGVRAAVGGSLAWVCDDAPGPRKVLAHRFPAAPNLGDVTRVDWGAVPAVDLIESGSPCTTLSLAGARAGMVTGAESNLWADGLEGIRALRPAFVVWENVVGALTAQGVDDPADVRALARTADTIRARARADAARRGAPLGDDDPDGFWAWRHSDRAAWLRADRAVTKARKALPRALDRVRTDLHGLGYRTVWRVVRASDVGMCHRRGRVFVLAWRDDDDLARLAARAQGRTGPSLPGDATRPLLPTPVAQPSGNTPERHLGKKPGRTKVTDLAVLVENGLLGAGGAPGRLLPTPQAHDAHGGKTREQRDRQRGRTGAGVANLNEVVVLDLAPKRLLPTPVASDADHGGPGQRHGGGGTPPLPAVACDEHGFGAYMPAVARQERLWGGPAPCPTVTGRHGKPQLNPRLVEWMMGAPPGWLCDVPGVSRSEAIRMGGNGCCEQQMAEAVALLTADAANGRDGHGQDALF